MFTIIQLIGGAIADLIALKIRQIPRFAAALLASTPAIALIRNRLSDLIASSRPQWQCPKNNRRHFSVEVFQILSRRSLPLMKISRQSEAVPLS